MKVELTPKLTSKKIKIKLPKANFLSKVKLFFTSKTPPLENDSFEKDNQKQVEEPKKTKRLTSRKKPNWCQTEDDPPNRTIAQRVCYYPEDVEKMEHMTEDEMIAYKRKMRKEGKYYIDNNYHVDTPTLDKFEEEHGISWRDFIIKDE